MLSGADDVEEMADFGRLKQAVLARHLALPHGVPTADTFRRVFEHLDAAVFNAAFLGWVRELLPAPVVAQVCGPESAAGRPQPSQFKDKAQTIRLERRVSGDFAYPNC